MHLYPYHIVIALAVVAYHFFTYSYCGEINLEKYLQPDDVGRNPIYDELPDNEYLCSRNCTKYPQSRICYYKFTAEQYYVMGPSCGNCPTNREDCFNLQCIIGDGIERTVLVFNRLLPGPAFHICDGDRIIVDVLNKMPAREVSIHWHGQLQKHSPWEDGVPFVTQCPIASNSWFRYDFLADTSGTHFYHSHSALQLFDGLSGAFVVHTSAETDPLSSLYDYDLFSHTIFIEDWMHEIIDVKYPGYNKNKTLVGIEPNSYLINGMGSYTDIPSKQQTNTPLAEFNVLPNKRYRFRIIPVSSTTCSTQFTIEGHSMLLIATDGYPVKPVEVRTLYLSSVDIYDVVVTTNQSPRPYWIRVQGYGSACSPAVQQAILRYKGSDLALPPTLNTPALFDAMSNLPELNNVRKPCQNNPGNVCLDKVKSMYKFSDRILKTPNQRYIFYAGTYQFTIMELYKKNKYHRHYLPVAGPGVKPLGGMYEDTINHMSNMYPPFAMLDDPKNPLISQMQCPEQCPKLCECLHLIKLPYNKVIEMIVVDELSSGTLKMDHPFHLHGHHFSIMKLGTKAQLTSDPSAFEVDTTNQNPLIRDSVPVPAEGFVIIRFIADNPGFWLFHCHFTSHIDTGMVIVFQVGEPEMFLPLPKNWPKCGNYLPPVCD